jgi:hypothetical protein
MAAKKDNKTSLYLLALVGIAGYIVYNKFKKDKEMKAIQDGKREVDVFDASYYTEERGRSFVSKELYENKDPEFMEHVKHLQLKLNDALKKMDAKDFPYYPLKDDGLLGYRTALAIARVYGEGYVPITDKKTITYLYTNFE